MTRAERIEAAARNVYGKNWDNPDSGKRPGEEMKVVWRELARKAIEGAYPELASGTHVLLPREPTEKWENWLPIEHAPRDRWILVAGGCDSQFQDVPPVVVAKFDRDEDGVLYWSYAHYDGDWRKQVFSPSHFQTLDDPPLENRADMPATRVPYERSKPESE